MRDKTVVVALLALATLCFSLNAWGDDGNGAGASGATDTATSVGETVQLIENGDFDWNVHGWECPYGRLTHSDNMVFAGPGAARVTTVYSVAHGHFATFGQCIGLEDALADWPIFEGTRHLTIEAIVMTGRDILELRLYAVVTAEPNCGTTHLERMEPVSINGGQGWTEMVATVAVPDGARSVHVFFWVTGTVGSAEAFVDEVCAYPGDPEEVRRRSLVSTDEAD